MLGWRKGKKYFLLNILLVKILRVFKASLCYDKECLSNCLWEGGCGGLLGISLSCKSQKDKNYQLICW